MSEDGEYWYRKGTNMAAVYSLAIAAFFSLGSVLVPKVWDMIAAGGTSPVDWITKYSWFIGCGAGFVAYYFIALALNVAGSADRRSALPVPEAA